MMINEDVQCSSFDALGEWAIYLRTQLNDACFQSTGNIIFNARVSYCHSGKELFGDASIHVTRNGFDDGKIKILSSNELDTNQIHTEFTPAWQAYSFDKVKGAFIVAGKSNKFGYKYQVVILPK